MIDEDKDEDVELLLGLLADEDLAPPEPKGTVRLWLAEHLPEAHVFDRPGGRLVARGGRLRMLLPGPTTCTVRVARSDHPETAEDLLVGRVLGVLEYADPRMLDRLARLL